MNRVLGICNSMSCRFKHLNKNSMDLVHIETLLLMIESFIIYEKLIII